jgi:hypothetical protein
LIHEEVWVEIEGFPEYIISNLGHIRHKDRQNTNRKAYPNHQGFLTIVLFKPPSKSRYVRHVNKLVASAFLEPPAHHDMTSVWHLDGDLLNCQADNLKWDRRDRVLEWNDMHRTTVPRYRTPNVMDNSTGRIYSSAFECGMATGEIESSVIAHVERYGDYADRGKYRYVDA